MGKGKRNKAMKRTAQRCINDSLNEVCVEFFNSLCEMRFFRRLWYAYRIVVQRRMKG